MPLRTKGYEIFVALIVVVVEDTVAYFCNGWYYTIVKRRYDRDNTGDADRASRTGGRGRGNRNTMQ